MSEQVDVVQVGLASTLLPEVQKAMTVERYADGAAKSGFLAVFEGRLTGDPEDAFSRLEEVFRRAGVQLMSASEAGQDVLYAVPAMPAVKPSNPWVNLGLFALTVFSVLLAGTLYGYSGAPDLRSLISALPTGIPFAASLLAILLAHEFGHYLAARYHKAPVSLPYFLPFPGSVFGTMGAFIRLKRPPRNRNVLLDIGLSGPLAGLVVAIPILLYGLSLSEVGPLPSDPRALAGLEGNSVLYLLAKYLVTGMWLPSPASHGDLPLLLYWLRYILLGQPLPLGGTDVYLSPIAWAGWAGLLVTALNLIPAGQLDGGHLVYVLLGPKAIKLWPAIVALTLLLGLVWSGWFLWAGLIFLLGRTFARPLDDITPLTPWRKAMAYFGLLVFVLVFTPVPLR